MTKFADIRKYTKPPCYHANISLDYLEPHIQNYIKEFNCQLDPDFQRGHVWSEDKQIAYVEFLIRGGQSAKDIYFNMPYWMRWRKTDFFLNKDACMVLVDGKQRIESIRKFTRNEIPVFGYTLNEYEDAFAISNIHLDFYVNNLITRKEVLQWYLDLNTGGVVHTTKEIEKVKKLLEKENNDNRK